MFFLFKRRRYCYCFNIILIVFVVFFLYYSYREVILIQNRMKIWELVEELVRQR
jgi:hypothetical protein